MRRRRLQALEDFCQHVDAGEQAYPEAFRLLRACVDSDHAGLFRFDAEGRMCGAFHEVPAHAPQAIEFIAKTRSGVDGEGETPTVAQLFEAELPVQQLRFETSRARESELFRHVIGPIGGRSVLRVGLRHNGRPSALLALVRGARGFSAHDERDLWTAARRYRRLLASVAPSERTLRGEGFLLVSAEGTITQMSSAARPLWDSMHDPRFIPTPDGASVVRSMCERHASREVLELGNGSFELEAISLEVPADAASTNMLLRLRHYVAPKADQLRRMELLGFSSMQKLVCLELLRGNTYPCIAEEYGIGVRTVITHVTDACNKASVEGRQALLAALDLS